MDYDDRGHGSMPKLVGGQTYRRPPAVGVQRIQRPPDPDDLPIASARTQEDEVTVRERNLDPAGATGSSPLTATAPGEFRPADEGWNASASSWSPSAPLRGAILGLFRGRAGRSGNG